MDPQQTPQEPPEQPRQRPPAPKPNPGELLYFDGDGVRLAAWGYGDPDGHPILFFHGQGQGKRQWAVAAELLGKLGFFGLSFDLRGHGDSDWAPDGDYSGEAYGRDVVAVIDQLGRRVTLVGGSRGAQVAFIAAAERPDQIRLLAICDIAPNVTILKPHRFTEFAEESAAGFASVEEAARAMERQIGFPVTDLEAIARVLQERDGRLHWYWDPKTAEAEYLDPEGEAKRLQQAVRGFTRPVLLLKGGRESYVSPENLREFKAMVPQLVVEIVAAATHIFTARENPVVAARLLYHLGRKDGPPEGRARPRSG